MSNIIPFPESDPLGWDTIPVECRADFQRAMARHPSTRAARATVTGYEPVSGPEPARSVMLDEGPGLGAAVAVCLFVGTAVVLFALYFKLV